MNINKQELRSFYTPFVDEFYNNEDIRTRILYFADIYKIDDELTENQRFNHIFNQMIEEAELTVGLLDSLNLQGDESLLEIGGGIGLTYGFLKSKNLNINSTEPSDAGFDGYHMIAQKIFEIMNIDNTNFYPYLAEDISKINKQFDIIFSNNVLEHILSIEPSISAMQKALKPNGSMIHNTVNYLIPYEPHLKIPIVPFQPKLTERFYPKLKDSNIWKGLYFINTKKVKNFAKKNNLDVAFYPNRMYETLKRLDYDEAFAERQKSFKSVYEILKKTGLINLIKALPVSMTTPITFTLKHK